MAQELTFEDWVIQGYKYDKFRDEFVICLKALDANMHKVLSEEVVASVRQYIDVFHGGTVGPVADEADMLQKLRLLREEIDSIKETEEKCLLVYQDVKPEIDEKDFCTFCISRSKTALDMLSRYLRGYPKKYANQAEYIRLIYTNPIKEKRESGVSKFTEKIRTRELKLVSQDQEIYNSVEEALSQKSFKAKMGITKVVRRDDEISVHFR